MAREAAGSKVAAGAVAGAAAAAAEDEDMGRVSDRTIASDTMLRNNIGLWVSTPLGSATATLYRSTNGTNTSPTRFPNTSPTRFTIRT